MKQWLLLMSLMAVPAWAQQDDPRFCPNRPSIGESGCTTQPGHVQIEMSAVDWTLDRTSGQRQDTVLIGDLQTRFGITDTGEVQLSWTPYGHVRTRDTSAGGIERSGGIGDVQVGYRQNLKNPDGKGLSLAIEPSVTLPVGGAAIGAGTWAAGLVVPVTYDLSDKLNVALTSEAQAAADESGDGRHFYASEVLGLSYDLTDAVTAVAEVQVAQDQDPAGHETHALAAGSLAWQPRHGVQLDVLVAAGLNRNTPDLRVLTGGAVGF